MSQVVPGVFEWLVGVIALVSLLIATIRIRAVPEKVASPAERAAWFDYLAGDAEMRAVRDATTAKFILAEAKSLAAGKLDELKTIESKASAQLSIIGGGIGLLSVFGASRLEHVGGSLALVLWSASSLVLSIVYNAATVWPGNGARVPAIDSFILEKIGAQPVMTGRIALTLAEGYADYGNTLTATVRSKSRRLRIAVFCFLAGVAGLAANSAIIVSASQSTHSTADATHAVAHRFARGNHR